MSIIRDKETYIVEKEMATHSSTLAWEIPWTEEPGGLQSMGSQRVGHNLVTKPPNPYWDVFTTFSVIVEIHYFIIIFFRDTLF